MGDHEPAVPRSIKGGEGDWQTRLIFTARVWLAVTSADGGIASADGGIAKPNDGSICADDGGISADDGGISADDGSICADGAGIRPNDGSISADDGSISADDGSARHDDVNTSTDDGARNRRDDEREVWAHSQRVAQMFRMINNNLLDGPKSFFSIDLRGKLFAAPGSGGLPVMIIEGYATNTPRHSIRLLSVPHRHCLCRSEWRMPNPRRAQPAPAQDHTRVPR